MMWIYLVSLFLSEARSMETGCNVTTTANNNTSLCEYRHDVFSKGYDANVTCSDKMWNETFYVIWHIELINKTCKIDFNSDGQNIDSCKDGKSIRNTSSTQPYLHIPKFSENDVGVYKCEFAFKGGSKNCRIDVGITVIPTVDAWLHIENDTTVAVCRATSGYPAAAISWSHTGRSPVQKLTEENGLFNVESHLELPEGIDPNNLSCIISLPNWKTTKIPKDRREKGYFDLWQWILIALMIIVVLAGFLFLVIKLRQYQQSDIASSKSTPLEDVEEVEPYASYIQRVNSIYN